jgi:hypothetical protein
VSRIPVHPLLVALVPVLSMYAVIPGTSSMSEVAIAAAAALAAGAVLFVVTTAMYRDFAKAALLVSVLLVVVLTFDHLYASVQHWEFAGIRVGRRRYVLPLAYLALGAFAVWLYRLKRPLATLTAVANLVALGAVLPPAFTIVTTITAASREAREVPPLEPIHTAAAPARKPDIYYFVFDRYGDQETMRANGLDNDEFYEYLQRTGFYVARESKANYIKTILSLASSLNMSYLNDIAVVHRGSANYLPVYDRVKHHRVGAFLRSHGYSYTHLGPWYWPMRDNPHATRNVHYYNAVPRPMVMLCDSVLLAPLQRALPRPWLDHRRQQWYRVTQQVEDVIAQVKEPGPKFVLLHVLIPHPPHVFDKDGTYLSADEEAPRSRQENYANQVLAANGMIRRMIDAILRESGSPPVIILQGDEGPYPRGTEANEYEWRRASLPVLRERSGILNAYYLPGVDPRGLYAQLSPVNSFRIVFNTYFGTQLPLLPDRTFRHASDYRPYELDDITDVLRPAARPHAVRTAMP